MTPSSVILRTSFRYINHSYCTVALQLVLTLGTESTQAFTQNLLELLDHSQTWTIVKACLYTHLNKRTSSSEPSTSLGLDALTPDLQTQLLDGFTQYWTQVQATTIIMKELEVRDWLPWPWIDRCKPKLTRTLNKQLYKKGETRPWVLERVEQAWAEANTRKGGGKLMIFW